MAIINHKILVIIFGMLGNIISLVVFFTPIHTFCKIFKRKSTEGHKSLPYLVALFSCMLWLYYAFLSKETFFLITINSFGCFIQTIYIILYIIYAPRDERKLILRLLSAFNVGIFALIILVTKYVVRDPLLRGKIVGWICVFLSVCVFASPLSSVAQVVRTKSVEFMPFYLSLCLTVSATMWFAYGLIVKDICIAIPNVLGFALGLLQMVVYAIYRNRGENAIEEN